MTVSVWQELAAPQQTVSHDVVVVGAGLVGSYTAGLLTEAGKDVALVEARHPAAGASGRNAGFVLLGVRHSYCEAVKLFGRDRARDIWTMTAENVGRMRDLAARFEVETEEIGATYLASERSDADDMRDSASELQRDGFDAHYEDGDVLRRGYIGALHQPTDFAMQPSQLAHGLARESRATLYENDEVFGIERDGAGLIVRARRHVITCEKVILAVNGYAGLFHPFFRKYVEPGRGQVLLTEPVPRMVDTMGMHHGWTYFRQLPDGRFLIGGGRFQYVDEERSYSDEITEHVQDLLSQYVERYFPEAAVGVSRRWAGIHGMTADGLPIVGRLPDEPEAYFAVGFSGHGNSLGLMAGERVAELALNETDPGVLGLRRGE